LGLGLTENKTMGSGLRTDDAARALRRIGAARLVAVPFEELLGAAKARQPWALERLYRAHAGAIAGYLEAQKGVDHESVANEVMERALRSLDGFTGDEGAFRGWLFAIARNALIDARRAANRRVRLELVAAPPERPDRAAADPLTGVGTERVQAVLAGLAPDQRDVLVLRIFGDLTTDQIAEILGKRPGAVKALPHRGIAALQRILAEDPYLFGADGRLNR
jgi:RNA polymerase sigma factor (sigma-70 family)